MNKYLIYKIDTRDLTLSEYKYPNDLGKDKVNIDPSKLELISKRELELSDVIGMRNSSLISEFFYIIINLPFEQYFIALKHKENSYYSNQLWFKKGRLVGSYPSFWTNFKFGVYLTIYLIFYIYIIIKLGMLIIGKPVIKGY